MLRLASQLIGRGFSITFVTTSQPPPHPHIQFVTIPHGLPKDFSFNSNAPHLSLATILHGLHQQYGLLEQLLQSSMATSSPIRCIISDFFLPWLQDLASKFDIPRVLLWTSNATAFYIGSLARPGNEAFASVEAVNRVQIGNAQIVEALYHEYLKVNKGLKMFQRSEEASHILVNSFRELEASFLPAAPPNVKFIGPCLLAESDDHSNDLTEEEVCLRWLDLQEANSVVFIALGSAASLKPLQIQEIAMGLEASHEKFLWVLRSDAEANCKDLPDGFQERTKGRGMIVSWAPQLRVLEHAAVGAFLSHCGWNSTLESIYMGVPMLCLPVFAEQPLNEQMVKANWKMGMGFDEKRNDGVVESKEVERVVREAMQGEGGRRARVHACQLKALARSALEKGGSSYADLASFVNHILKTHSKK